MVEVPHFDYLNVTDTARLLGVHPNTVRNWANAGVLKSQRVPGSRFNRFLATDVERLASQRGRVAITLQEERTNVRVGVAGSPEYVDATDLDAWARRTISNTEFPRLMRRLLASTPNITGIRVRAGDGVSLGGWDGVARSSGSAFLPAGWLSFEFGTGANPRGKADDDYKKRAQDDDAKDRIFIFATPKRWPGAGAWAARRRKERRFADVVALDADTLEGWLEASPSVHVWVSELFDRSPAQAQTLGVWWTQFSKTTDPPLVPELFVAGRDEQRQQLLARLAQSPEATLIQADSIADCLAFANAVLDAVPDDQPPLPSAVVVTSADVWRRVVAQFERSILIPQFAEPDVAIALRNGHHVLLTADRATATRSAGIELPRLDRSRVAELLQVSGVEFLDAQRLSALARRSLPAMIRKLSKDPRLANPLWTQLPSGATLATLLLAGRWLARPDDLKVVGELIQTDWEKLEGTLRLLEKSSDPPLRLLGDRWAFASPEEAFILLASLLTRRDAATWLEVVSTVLLEPDPVRELPAEERFLAGARGIRRKYSPELREGLAEAAALMSELGTKMMVEGQTSLAGVANSAVRRLLESACADRSGGVWRDLAGVLPTLAEAAPDVFLDAVSDDLAQAAPSVLHMFEVNLDSPRAFGTSSSHTHLLWALERLCWSDDYLVQATRILSLLAASDPEATSIHGNRPRESLASVLSTWVRNTGASPATHRQAIEVACRTAPDVGWQLLVDLIPDGHAWVMPPAAPQIRDWRPTRSGVPMPELIGYMHEIVGLAVDLAAGKADRLSKLAEHLNNLPPDDREAIFATLERQSPEALPADERLHLWEQLDRLVARHRSFSTAAWALPADQLERLDQVAQRLKPIDDPQRFSYLFGGHPDLPDVEASDFDAREARLRELRHEALITILTLPNRMEALEQLARHVEAPIQLAWALADELDVSIHDLAPWLDPEERALWQVANGWAQRKTHGPGGTDWLIDALQAPELSVRARRAIIANAPAIKATWDALATTGVADDAAYYWDNAPMHATNLRDLPEAARQLVAHERAWAAVELVGRGIHIGRNADETEPSLDVDVVKIVLTNAMHQSAPEQDLSSTTSYTIGVLLDYLEQAGISDQELTSFEFSFYRLIEHHRGAPALGRALASDPHLFVELTSRVYRGKTEPPRDLNEHDSALASQSWWVLNGWHGCPGQQADGRLNGDAMLDWVRAARLAFSESDRADIGDEVIGQSFGRSPIGDDGNWPAEVVRDMVETVGSRELENGLILGKVNGRGVTSRGPYDGGTQERALAASFRAGSAATKAQWPRTSRLLRELAESYERDAQREDIQAEQYADEG